MSCVKVTGASTIVARGTKTAATARTARTPRRKKPIRAAGREVQPASRPRTLARRAVNSCVDFRGVRRRAFVVRGRAGQVSRCAFAVVRKTGMPKPFATRQTVALRLTRPRSAPRYCACCCRMRRSSGRSVIRSNRGQTSKMRGALAQLMRSRTDTRSSCDSRLMICVFIRPHYNFRQLRDGGCGGGSALIPGAAVLRDPGRTWPQ